jgi:RHH-type proline utilization regulon transcriptional repressor/proline dehydrogenase/delta 1-pyrroline-5-carboxylate dehydrogenase
VERLPLPAATAQGTFVAPTVIEIGSLAQVGQEVFGPVLHVLRFRRAELGRLIDEINAGGYGLTFGVHSRIDETIDFVTSRIRAGNIYVNRNMIGAVVGVQPFGGLGLSGTGPKAGGPLLLARLRRGVRAPALPAGDDGALPPALLALRTWAQGSGRAELAQRCSLLAGSTPLRQSIDLPGPTGESNRLRFIARGRVLCIAGSEDELLHQVAVALATGNRAVLCSPVAGALAARLPDAISSLLEVVAEAAQADCDVVLCPPSQAIAVRRAVAAREGPRARVVTPSEPGGGYPLDALVAEQTLTVNTAAAGGNAGLMTLAPE